MSKRRALRIKLPQQATKPVLLYRLVFASFTMRFMVFVMLGFFALQPVSLIYANESEAEAAPNEAESEVAEEIDVEDTEITEELDNDVSVTDEENSSTENINPETQNPAEPTETIVEVIPEIIATSSESNNEPVTDTATTTSEVVATTTEPIVDESATTTPEIVEIPLDDSEVIDEEVIDEEIVFSTSTTAITPVHTSDNNRYQFSETECSEVADGSYYCSKAPVFDGISDTTSLRATMDEEGDTEIYLTIDGEILQLSNNLVDDNSPKYDSISESVVWHRLIDGRYEIVTYDLKTDIESIMTDNDTNDMEPDRSGDYTVWQRWSNDNWEIVLFDGREEKQITTNDKHDVAPSVRGEFVIWHTSASDGTRQVAVYEIKTGLISEIADTEGGVVENPRFVLVYDTTFENGDVITKGYDFGSGEVVPLSAVPGDLPEELPEPDQTGETRALIQTKSTSREEGDDNNDDLNLNPNATSTATSSPSLIDPLTNTIDLSDTPADQIVELTEYDLVITPYEGNISSSTQDSHSTSTINLVE